MIQQKPQIREQFRKKDSSKDKISTEGEEASSFRNMAESERTQIRVMVRHCYRLNFVTQKNSYIEVLILNALVCDFIWI